MLKKTLVVAAIIATVSLCGCTKYDVNTPDTTANRNGIERHLKIKPGNSISQVYYYADEIGADVRYQLSFKCDKKTIDQIIANLSLSEAPPDYNGLNPRDDLSWWGPDSIKDRDCWVKQKKGEYFWELWYSEKDNIAFYQEYSI